ncbi:MAG: GYF domain-containing protein [Lacunisphaera sp.]
MKYHYTNAQNQPVGPVDFAELNQLAAQGIINDQTSVIPEGGQTWSTWGAIRGGAPVTSPAAPPDEAKLAGIATILGDTVAGILIRLAGWLSPALLQNSLKLAGRYGHFAVLASAGLGLILAIVLATRMHSVATFVMLGIGYLLVIAVAQFSAQRFLSAGAALLANTPSRLSSKSFLQCVGLFAILGAAGTFLGGLVGSIQADSLLPMIPAVLMGALLLYFAMAALHCEVLNVSISGEATAGEDAISLLSFFCKAGLVLAPLFYFLLSVVGAILILLTMFNVGQVANEALLVMLPLPPMTQVLAQNSPGQMLVLIACLVPVLSYFFFLLAYLSLDVIRAVLVVPGKLDALRKP